MSGGFGRILLVLVTLLGLAACDKAEDEQAEETGPAYGPQLTDEHMPDELGGLRLGEATEAEILALFPESEVSRDRAFGGDEVVMSNDEPAIFIERPRPGSEPHQPLHDLANWSFTLVAREGETPVMVRFSLTKPRGQSGWCNRMRETIGADPESTRCRGSNRRYGDEGDFQTYCIGTADGSQRVSASCDNESEHAGETISFSWPSQ